MIGLLLVFVAVFLFFVLALFWAQWQKHSRPIARVSDDGEGFGTAVAPGAARTPPETVAYQAAAQRVTPYADDSRLRPQVTVSPLPEAYPVRRTDGQLYRGAATAALRSTEPGRIRDAELAQQDSAHTATGGTIPGGEERPYGVPKELEGATWLRFHFHTPGQPPKNASAKVATQERLRTTVDSATPGQLRRIGSSRLFPSGQTDTSRVPQELSTQAHVVEAPSYLKSALRLCSKMGSDDTSAAAARPAVPGASRPTSEKERILVLALWGIVVPAAVIFALFPSKTVQMRLKPQPPADFIYYQERSDPKSQAAEKTMAQDYWKCAVQSIQYRYARNEPLPAAPPPEFNIASGGSQRDGSNKSAVVREQYWENLRKVWTQPDIWEKSSVTTSSWASDLFAYLEGIVNKYAASIRERY